MPMLKFPWVSLVLLLSTYATLGWILSAFDDPLYIWVTVGSGIFLLALALSSPWSKTIARSLSLFQSDSRTFVVAITIAFLSVLIITWFHIFAHGLVVTSASTLFKLDAQLAGLSQAKTFWILAIASLTGLCIGGVAQTLVSSSL